MKKIKKNKVKFEEIEAIVEKYNTNREIVMRSELQPEVFGPLLPRLGRAALNQVEPEGDAMFSRFAIWASDASDMLIKATYLLERRADAREIMPLLIEVTNSLSAFSDIQDLFDPLFHGHRNE